MRPEVGGRWERTVLAEKICGAAAEQKRSLKDVAELCRKVNANGRSMGMALTSCTVPAADSAMLTRMLLEIEYTPLRIVPGPPGPIASTG